MAARRKTGGRRKGSRNRATREITELARRLVPAAIRELGKLLKDAQSESAKVAAIGMVFDRAYGKAPQAIQHSGTIGTYDLTKLKDADLDKLEAILRPIADAPADTGGETPTLN
jgi:hypothetical protein